VKKFIWTLLVLVLAVGSTACGIATHQEEIERYESPRLAYIVFRDARESTVLKFRAVLNPAPTSASIVADLGIGRDEIKGKGMEELMGQVQIPAEGVNIALDKVRETIKLQYAETMKHLKS
jgi:hypothetical protein